MIKGGIVNKYSSKVRIYYQHRMCHSLLRLTLVFYFYIYCLNKKRNRKSLCKLNFIALFQPLSRLVPCCELYGMFQALDSVFKVYNWVSLGAVYWSHSLIGLWLPLSPLSISFTWYTKCLKKLVDTWQMLCCLWRTLKSSFKTKWGHRTEEGMGAKSIRPDSIKQQVERETDNKTEHQDCKREEKGTANSETDRQDFVPLTVSSDVLPLASCQATVCLTTAGDELMWRSCRSQELSVANVKQPSPGTHTRSIREHSSFTKGRTETTA